MRGADLVYRSGKVHSEPPQSVKYSRELVLTPLELINRIAQRVPPPRTHRHRFYGVLAPNSLLRAAMTAMAMAKVPVPVCSTVAEDANARAGTAVAAVALGGPGGVQDEPDWDLATQSPPDYPDDQRTAW